MHVRLLPLLFVFAAAITVNAQTSELVTDTEAKSLLLRSYALTQHLPAAKRADVLGRQAELASELDEQLARNWAEELFSLTAGLPEDRRVMAQQMALGAMSKADPVRAYAMARQIQWPERRAPASVYDRIVITLWTRQGEAALSSIQSILSDLSGTRAYPYLAAAQCVRNLQGTNPAAAQMLFRDAAASYAKAPSQGESFAHFVISLSTKFPAELMRPVLANLVENLLADNTTSDHYFGRLTGRDNKVIEFHSPSTGGLIMLASVMRAVDPVLLERVESLRPEVGAAERGSFGLSVSTTPAGAPPPAVHNPSRMTFYRSYLGDGAGGRDSLSRDFDAGLAEAKAIQDVDRRALAVVDLTIRMPWLEAAQSRAAIVEANALVPKMKNQETALYVLASVATSAQKLGDTSLATSAVNRGFAIMSGLNKQPAKAAEGDAKDFLLESAFNRFVRAAGEVDLQLATEHLDDYSSPLLQARLLVEAASGHVHAAELKRRMVQGQHMMQHLSVQGTRIPRKDEPCKLPAK